MCDICRHRVARTSSRSRSHTTREMCCLLSVMWQWLVTTEAMTSAQHQEESEWKLRHTDTRTSISFIFNGKLHAILTPRAPCSLVCFNAMKNSYCYCFLRFLRFTLQCVCCVCVVCDHLSYNVSAFACILSSHAIPSSFAHCFLSYFIRRFCCCCYSFPFIRQMPLVIAFSLCRPILFISFAEILDDHKTH